MFRRPIEQWAGAAGLAFVVLFIAGIVAGGVGATGFTGVGMVPANPQESVAVLRANTAVLGLSTYLISLAALALVCFSSGLASALRRSQRNDGALWMLAQAGGLAVWGKPTDLWRLQGQCCGSGPRMRFRYDGRRRTGAPAV